MALPINISELIHGKVVEWERLEFKEGWNPASILKTVCAFANDINNWGGGYIVLGISATNGIPLFPPKGLSLDSIDNIQSQLIEYCYKIQPNYLPITQPYIIDGKHILVIWCPAGDMRPYSCPSSMVIDGRRQYFIRSGSKSIIPLGDMQTRLLELTAKVPFDDRINQAANLNDLDLGLIRSFLQKVGSDLFEESTNMPFPELCKAMQIARGPIEAFRPVNVGLLFFNEEPSRFFQRAWI
jgi:ATP-dependent DNA helicase RecG